MLMTASTQWATRPDDQRFTSLHDMLAFTRGQRNISHESIEASRSIQAVPTRLIDTNVLDPKALTILIDDKDAVHPTNYAFGQLASLVGAPAGYLRKLPADLAADNLNWGAYSRDVQSVGILKRINGQRELAAATGPDYGRVWNETIVSALVDRFGDGVTGEFTVPGEFGVAVDVTKANTTLYASDRDMFVFLADEKNRIEVPDRRDGKGGTMARGFFVSNSEVGNSSLMISTFLFDYVCCNRIVWGPRDYKEIRIRHSKGAPLRWIDEVRPAIEAYAHSSTSSIDTALANARQARLEGDKLDDFLNRRFNRNQVQAIKNVHVIEEDRPIETMWDVVTGVTAYAKGIKHQDARVGLEREAGKILDLVAR